MATGKTKNSLEAALLGDVEKEGARRGYLSHFITDVHRKFIVCVHARRLPT